MVGVMIDGYIDVSCTEAPADMSIMAWGLQSVTLHTNLGDIKLELYCEEAPRTAQNFLALCASGYYDGVIFHR